MRTPSALPPACNVDPPDAAPDRRPPRSPVAGETSEPGLENADGPQGATAPCCQREPCHELLGHHPVDLLVHAPVRLDLAAHLDLRRHLPRPRVVRMGQAIWGLFIIVVPWLGALVYLIARGRSMNERTLAQARRHDQAFRDYVQDAAGNQPSAADEITKLAALRDQGATTEQEFAHAKTKLLGTPSPNGAPAPANQSASMR